MLQSTMYNPKTNSPTLLHIGLYIDQQFTVLTILNASLSSLQLR